MKRKLNKIELASLKVTGFNEILEQLIKSMLINGLSKSTRYNYCFRIAEVSLHFNKLPQDIAESEFQNYLSDLIIYDKGHSRSLFKHTVYGLRYYFKIFGISYKIKLPQIKHEKNLPRVLSKGECKLIFDAVKNHKHKLMLQFAYSAGLRMNELLHLRWVDLDIDRMTVFIKKSKGNKDRYVPFSKNLLKPLHFYLKQGSKSPYVFSTNNVFKKYSPSGIRFLMRQAVKKAGILKEGICLHTLRHSYATHLMEDGLDIFSIKELLGHSRIETTLVYLHIVDQEKLNKFSPLDTLYELEKEEELSTIKLKYKEIMLNRIIQMNQTKNQFNLFE